MTVLTWHALVERVEELGQWPPEARLYVFTIDEFRRQLDHLAAEGFTTVSVADLVRWQAGQAELPEKPILLSFDDGHRSNAELALPELRARDQKAIFFVTAGRIEADSTSQIPNSRLPAPIGNRKSEIGNPAAWVTWPDLRALLDAGMEIGSHTLTHRSPSTLSRDALRHELAESRRVLEEGLGAAVDFVASPTGYDSRHFGPLAREVGYRAALQGVIGRNRRSTAPFALRRIVLKRSYGFGLFRRLVDPQDHMHRRLRFAQALRNAARRVLGQRGYEAIRRCLLGRRRDEGGC